VGTLRAEIAGHEFVRRSKTVEDTMAQAPTASPKHIVIRPNRSLSFRGMVWLFSAYLGLMAVIGLGFLSAGAWMVLPFAGIEALLIFLVFYFVVCCHTNDYELVIIDGEKLSVISHQGSSQSHHEFPHYWAKLKLECSEHSWYPSRLMLGCYGRFVEIGSGLREQDRQALAKKLRSSMTSPTFG
jgi:uncharacterized membrane protein